VEPNAEAVATRVVERLRAQGHEALFVGGWVRDRLLGRRIEGPADVATSARPEDVRRLFPRTVAVGEQFGVVIVVENGVHVEVATFRADAEYEDGRHPTSVRFTSAEEDAKRRDFTINGMFLDPRTGEVLDFVGGRDDIERRVVRAIGDPRERFTEDKLRMIRAIRFAARLGFAIDPPTTAAIREMAPEIAVVSKERVGEELVKILTDGGARRGFELLAETGLLVEVLPEIDALKGVEQGRDYHPEGDVFTHTLLALGGVDRSAKRTETLALGVLLHDVAKRECQRIEDGKIMFYGHCERGAEIAEEICRRLRRSNAIGERVAWLVKNHLRAVNAPQMRVATLKRFLREPWIEELLELCEIDASAASGDLQYVNFCRAKLAELAVEEIAPPPLVTGRDLIELGHRPGPRFKEILHAVEEAQLEGALADREQAIAFVRERYPAEDGFQTS
jgi:poly(A) polymerase